MSAPDISEQDLERRYLDLRLEEELGHDRGQDLRERVLQVERPVDERRRGWRSATWWVAAAMVLLGSGIVIALTHATRTPRDDGAKKHDVPESRERRFAPRDMEELRAFLRGITRVELCALELPDPRVPMEPDLRQLVSLEDPAELAHWRSWQPTAVRAPDVPHEPEVAPPEEPSEARLVATDPTHDNRVLLHGGDGTALEVAFEGDPEPRLLVPGLGALHLDETLADEIRQHLAEALRRSIVAHGFVAEARALTKGSPRALPADQTRLALLDPDAETLALLAGYPELRRVAVHLSEDDDGTAALRAILALPKLTELEMHVGFDGFLGRAARELLARAERLERLVLVGDSENPFTKGAPFPHRLEHLVLRDLVLIPGALGAALTNARLLTLELDRCGFQTRTQLTELAAQTRLLEFGVREPAEVQDDGFDLRAIPATVTRLALEGNTLEASDANALGRCTELVELSLRGSHIVGDALAPLTKLPRLARVDLARCSGIDEGAVLDLGECTALRWLSLEGTDLGKRGLRILAKSTTVATLRIGGLAHFEPGMLAGLSALRTLRELSLHGTRELQDRDLDELAKLAALERLDLGQCPGISAAKCDTLRAALPKVELTTDPVSR